MLKASIKLHNGKQVLVLGLGDTDIQKLKMGEQVLFDLDSVDVGLWYKAGEGAKSRRNFLQPRDSRVMLIAGDTPDALGELLGAEMPNLEPWRSKEQGAPE